jgi:hypothetical protein
MGVVELRHEIGTRVERSPTTARCLPPGIDPTALAALSAPSTNWSGGPTNWSGGT